MYRLVKMKRMVVLYVHQNVSGGQNPCLLLKSSLGAVVRLAATALFFKETGFKFVCDIIEYCFIVSRLWL